ncbi:MAG: flippase-like domain-containing protein [Gemmatimonadetes bacterium]|nr:flippase-like domain-containing protein [Gemmatimonadota bacterium]
MSSESADGKTRRRGVGRLVSAFSLSYLFGAFLLVSLFYAFGTWDVLAGSRFLDLLIRVGIVKYHDQNLGFVEGVADHKYYLTSQTPVDWLLVFFAGLLFLGFFAVKTLQFDGAARHFGAKGTLGQNGRAYLYGLGLDRWFPFGLGRIGTHTALTSQGSTDEQSRNVLFATGLFILFEISLFAIVGLLGEGWGPWAGQVVWGAFVFALLYLWVRRPPGASVRSIARAWTGRAREVLGSLASDPPVLAKLCALSVIAFALEDVAAYVIANAFGIGVEFSVIVMGLGAGYVARLIPLSPGGIGQYEWGFAVALVLGGVGAPEAATLAILDNLLRYLVGAVVVGSVIFWYGVDTTFRRVLSTFSDGLAAESET